MQTGALATGLTHDMASWEARDSGSYTYLAGPCLPDAMVWGMFLRTYGAQGLVPDGSHAQR